MQGQDDELIDQAAAGWLARLRAGPIEDEARREFSQWLQADARHGQRLAHYESLWIALDDLRNEPRVLALREASGPADPRRRFAVAAAAVAAVLLVIAGFGAGSWFSGWGAASHAPAVTSRLATGIGQISRMTLQDGSTLILDSDSAVETAFTAHRRDIRITRGRAFFHVAHDRSRPFVVATDKVAVTATGTQFTVALDDGRDMVRMIEGSVVATSLEGDTAVHLPLKAGQSLSVVAGGRWAVMRSDGARDLDWTTGILTFRDARLAEIAADLNRYSTRKITFADSRAADRRLDAVIRTDDLATFLESVKSLRIAKVKVQTDDVVVLESP